MHSDHEVLVQTKRGVGSRYELGVCTRRASSIDHFSTKHAAPGLRRREANTTQARHAAGCTPRFKGAQERPRRLRTCPVDTPERVGFGRLLSSGGHEMSLKIDPQELLIKTVQRLEDGWHKGAFRGPGNSFCIRGALQDASVEIIGLQLRALVPKPDHITEREYNAVIQSRALSFGSSL